MSPNPGAPAWAPGSRFARIPSLLLLGLDRRFLAMWIQGLVLPSLASALCVSLASQPATPPGAPFVVAPTVWTVDANGSPGTDFLAPQGAIISPLVQPGDVLRILPGEYGAVVINKPLALIGLGDGPLDVELGSGGLGVEIADPGGPVAIAGIHVDGILHVHDCDETVTLTQLITETLDIDRSPDVRFDEWQDYPFYQPRFTVDESGFDLVNAEIGSGLVFASFFTEVNHVRLAQTQLYGSNGFDAGGFIGQAGNGLPALRLSTPTVAQLLGPNTSLTGGNGGWGFDCSSDGLAAAGLVVDDLGASARASGVQLIGGNVAEPGCSPTQVTAEGVEVIDGEFLEPAIPDPSLERIGTPVRGSTLRLVAHAPSAQMTWIALGAQPLSLDLPGVVGRVSVAWELTLAAGTPNAQGLLSVQINVPTDLELGSVYHAQSVSFYGGEEPLRVSNPVALVVR